MSVPLLVIDMIELVVSLTSIVPVSLHVSGKTRPKETGDLAVSGSTPHSIEHQQQF
jgi:hypothetical protein